MRVRLDTSVRPGACWAAILELRKSIFAVIACSGMLGFCARAQTPVPTSASDSSGQVRPGASSRAGAPASSAQAENSTPSLESPAMPLRRPGKLPSVAFKDGVLTIDADESLLSDVLDAIHRDTGAKMDLPDGKMERYTCQLTGPPREVISELLDGSGFGYFIMGSTNDPNRIEEVVLTRPALDTSANLSSANSSQGRTQTAQHRRVASPVTMPYTPPDTEEPPTMSQDSVASGAGNADAVAKDRIGSMEDPNAELQRVPSQAVNPADGVHAAVPDNSTSPNPASTQAASDVPLVPEGSGTGNADTAPKGKSHNDDQSQQNLGLTGQFLQKMYQARQAQQQSQPPSPPQ